MDREREFITRVVDLVGQGVFKRGLVLTVMQKARFYHGRFPFRYIRTMMQMLAEKRRIDLPF